MNENAASRLITLNHLEDLENGVTELYDTFDAFVSTGWLFKTGVVKKRRRRREQKKKNPRQRGRKCG